MLNELAHIAHKDCFPEEQKQVQSIHCCSIQLSVTMPTPAPGHRRESSPILNLDRGCTGRRSGRGADVISLTMATATQTLHYITLVLYISVFIEEGPY